MHGKTPCLTVTSHLNIQRPLVISLNDTSAGPRSLSGGRHRVGGGITPAVLPHHRAYGSVHGDSCCTLEAAEPVH
jgi:hypothetical protein